MRATITRTSTVPAPASEVWVRIMSAEGINAELRPWLRMTLPAELRGASIEHVEPGRRLGRSWILLLGLVPVDYDDLTLVELEPGRRFLERSPMGSMRFWEHERTVAPGGTSSCEVTDRVTFEPRIPGAGRIARRALTALFAHRHRRLVAHFSSAPHDLDLQR